MAWMIGIDEAGYGPNLGPLVVAATAWKAEGGRRKAEGGGGREQGAGIGVLTPPVTAVDLYQRLSSIVSAAPDENRLAIADSKLLYKPGAGLRLLERGVLAALGVVGPPSQLNSDATARWRDLIDGDSSLPWYADYDCALPIDAVPEEIVDLTDRFTAACGQADVQLVDVKTRLVFPREFNELTDHYGTKGAALSHVTIDLLRQILSDLRPPTSDPCYVSCDKHGGRNRYAALLQHHFPDHWIDTLHESRPESRYVWGPPEGRVQVTFRARGEAELPTALASMTAKYHRELCMRAFNAYWGGQISGLQATAGYPVDARRFKSDIAGRQRELAIDDRDLWRNR